MVVGHEIVNAKHCIGHAVHLLGQHVAVKAVQGRHGGDNLARTSAAFATPRRNVQPGLGVSCIGKERLNRHHIAPRPWPRSPPRARARPVLALHQRRRSRPSGWRPRSKGDCERAAVECKNVVGRVRALLVDQHLRRNLPAQVSTGGSPKNAKHTLPAVGTLL